MIKNLVREALNRLHDNELILNPQVDNEYDSIIYSWMVKELNKKIEILYHEHDYAKDGRELIYFMEELFFITFLKLGLNDKKAKIMVKSLNIKEQIDREDGKEGFHTDDEAWGDIYGDIYLNDEPVIRWNSRRFGEEFEATINNAELLNAIHQIINTIKTN